MTRPAHADAPAPDELCPNARDAGDRIERLAYSPAEAAKALGISRANLYGLIADGSLASFVLGRRRLIRPAALRDLLDRLEGGSS